MARTTISVLRSGTARADWHTATKWLRDDDCKAKAGRRTLEELKVGAAAEDAVVLLHRIHLSRCRCPLLPRLLLLLRLPSPLRTQTPMALGLVTSTRTPRIGHAQRHRLASSSGATHLGWLSESGDGIHDDPSQHQRLGARLDAVHHVAEILEVQARQGDSAKYSDPGQGSSR